MPALSPDSISRKDRKELARLRKNRRGLPFFLLLASAMFLVAIVFSFVTAGRYQRGDRDYTRARQHLASSSASWSQEFLKKQEQYGDWLSRRGVGFESRVFEAFSRILFQGASGMGEEREDLSFAGRTFISFLFALLRISFIFLACWRLWSAVLLLACVWSVFSIRPYRKRDVLGQTGNERLFYSGIRAGLDNLDEQGAPAMQVVGLACPRAVSPVAAKTSEFGRILESMNASNDTNLGLAAVILAHDRYPAYVAEREEIGLLAQVYSGVSLPANAACVLQAALSLQAAYRSLDAAESVALLKELEKPAAGAGTGGKLDERQYAALLKTLFHRVLTPKMRGELAQLSPKQIATAVLALEAGKVMTWAYEGERWLRRSSFGQLNARAVMHSMPPFAVEYSQTERSAIRKAIIYASRKSVFAPVRFPIDFTGPSRALRQWIELLMACPHELHAVADEAELVGLVAECHELWLGAFFDRAMVMNPDVVDGVFASSANLLFMPVTKVVKLMRDCLEPWMIRRLEVLVNMVSQKQKLMDMSAGLRDEEPSDKVRGALQDRILMPLSHNEIRDLARIHSLPAEDLKDWSALRVILNSFSWLARRVGDMTVPDSSVVFSVFRPESEEVAGNEFGFLGQPGLVPLRTSRLVSRWGNSWSARFVQVGLASMAEERDSFDRLMRGEIQSVEDDNGDSQAGGGL